MQGPSRSPIKDKPHRHPGQSLEEERRELVFDKVLVYAVLAIAYIMLAVLEWIRYFMKLPPTPMLMTFVALGGVCLAVWRYRKQKPRLDALRQGIEGEKVVGQYLERLREAGYQVFHDITGPDFNVDHVLIGRAGVFTIETKTWSKPTGGDARIRYDATELTAGGFAPDRSPIVQAKAQSSWIRNLLSESTGRTFTVTPVVVFPGWFVEPPKDRPRDFWVLEPKALPSFLKNEPERMAAEEVKLASYHLSRFIRSSERERTA